MSIRVRISVGRMALITLVMVTLVMVSSFAPIALATTSPPSTSPPTTVTISPQQYVALALDFVEQQSLRKRKVDWAGIRTRAEQRAAKAASIPDTYPIIVDTLAALGDRHSSFQPPVQADQLLQGKVNGYGFVASWPQRVVVSLSTGGPAAKAGLKLRDRIDSVQGRKPVGVNGVLAIPQKNGSFPTVLRLTVTRPPLKTSQPSKKLTISIRFGESSTVETPKSDPVTSAAIGDRIGYLELPGLVGTPDDQQRYAQQAHDAMTTLNSTPRCGWVIDLRRNRGGYIFPMLMAVGPLLGPTSGAVIAGKLDGQDRFERWIYAESAIRVQQADAPKPSEPVATVETPFTPSAWDVPVALLTSNLTASAAEAVAVSFKSRPNARSFGEPTQGLTTFNVLRALPDNALIIVANASFADRSGQTFDGAIPADETIKNDFANFGTAKDPVLTSATRWLNEQQACR